MNASTRIAQHGYSLLEVIVAGLIALVLLTAAVPAWKHARLNAGRTATLNELTGALQAARSSATSSGTASVVCASDDGQSCAGVGASWRSGILVFSDRDGNNAYSPVDRVLRYIRLPSKSHRIFSNRQAYRLRPFARRSSNGTLEVCDERGPIAARALIISPSSRSRISDRRADGRPLQCAN